MRQPGSEMRNEGNDNNASPSTTPKPQKEVQCSFRIINILFSDTFAADFATLGNIADRNLLDSGRARNDEIFWVGVHHLFVQPNPVDFDNLRFLDNASGNLSTRKARAHSQEMRTTISLYIEGYIRDEGSYL
jgi:hypothetical protein